MNFIELLDSDPQKAEHLTEIFRNYYTARRAAWTQGKVMPYEADYVQAFIDVLNGGDNERRNYATDDVARD